LLNTSLYLGNGKGSNTVTIRWYGQWRNFGLKSGGPSSRCTNTVGVRPPLQKVGVRTQHPPEIMPMGTES